MSIRINRYLCMILPGVMCISLRAMALDIPINITGTIMIPPCKINNGQVIEVSFGDIVTTDISNKKNIREVTVPVKCSYIHGDMYLKVTGSQLGNDNNVLATNLSGVGIALWQGTGTDTKMILGEGNGRGYRLIKGIQMDSQGNGNFTFTAIPFKSNPQALTTGTFEASASMSIMYN